MLLWFRGKQDTGGRPSDLTNPSQRYLAAAETATNNFQNVAVSAKASSSRSDADHD